MNTKPLSTVGQIVESQEKENEVQALFEELTLNAEDSRLLFGVADENEPTEKEKSQARTNAILPYVKAWLARSVRNRLLASYKSRQQDSFTVNLAWLKEQFGNPENREFFRKEAQAKITRFFKPSAEQEQPPQVPEWPNHDELTSWEFMRAIMRGVRHLNFGLEQQKVRMQINATSDHQQRQALFTGETVWTEPTTIKFDYWVVENGDYSEPYSLQWIKDPNDERYMIQVKMMERVPNVLKMHEKTRKSDVTQIGRLLQMKPGDVKTLRVPFERESEAEKAQQNFLEKLSSLSLENNIRFQVSCPSPFEIVVAHAGELYRKDNIVPVDLEPSHGPAPDSPTITQSQIGE